MVLTITLTKGEWKIGAPIGAGGFGRVFEATAADDRSAAVAKFVKKAPGADRELLFESLAGVPNIVPVIDSGETADDWVLVMPRADESLADRISTLGRPFTVAETVEVLCDVSSALEALDGRVVHRDIKPENILLLGGHWCLADFGIARYAEKTTEANTFKFAGTAAYTAPERWRGERAVAASDVYSLGIVAFQLVTGRLPFPGPDGPAFREQHLGTPAPSIGNPPLLATMVAECLAKSPAARPTAANLSVRLPRVAAPASPAGSRLQGVNASLSTAQAAAGAAASAAAVVLAQRRELAADATRQFRAIADQLAERILQDAPLATLTPNRGEPGWQIKLGQAELTMGLYQSDRSASVGASLNGVDIVVAGEISLKFPKDRWEYAGREHNLWSCDAENRGTYRWYEIAWMFGAFQPYRGVQNPFALTMKDAAEGANAVLGSKFQQAWPFTPVDRGDEERFFEQWIDWLARAAQGELRASSSMPERPVPHWPRGR